MLSIPKQIKGIETSCNGCRATIKKTDDREIFEDLTDDGKPFRKILCKDCIKEIVDKFRSHLIEKEKKEKASKEILSGTDEKLFLDLNPTLSEL